jgi:hypothetical protein
MNTVFQPQKYGTCSPQAYEADTHVSFATQRLTPDSRPDNTGENGAIRCNGIKHIAANRETIFDPQTGLTFDRLSPANCQTPPTQRSIVAAYNNKGAAMKNASWALLTFVAFLAGAAMGYALAGGAGEIPVTYGVTP